MPYKASRERIRLVNLLVDKVLLLKGGWIWKKQMHQERALFPIPSSDSWTRSAKSCASSIIPSEPRELTVSGSNVSSFFMAVLSQEEVRRVLHGMTGTHQLMAKLLYGTGMRLMECVRLRVKDLDFARNQLVVREGKGFKDRVTMFSGSIKTAAERFSSTARPERQNRSTDLGKGMAKESNVSIPMPFPCQKFWGTLGRSNRVSRAGPNGVGAAR